MGKGSNNFRHSDAVRAIASARSAGIEPTMVEIIVKDGTTFRIYGPQAAPIVTGGKGDGVSACSASARQEWQADIDKLRAKKK